MSLQTTIIHIDGMTCGGCVRAVTRTITQLDDKAAIEADPESRTVILETTATGADVIRAVVRGVQGKELPGREAGASH